MNNEDKILSILEGIQKQISEMEQSTNCRFESLEKLIVEEIKSTRDELKTEIQHVYNEIKAQSENLNNIEQVTAKNFLDISRLKAVK